MAWSCSACGSANDVGRVAMRRATWPPCARRAARPIGPGDRFCGECGAALVTGVRPPRAFRRPSPPADAEPVVTERRLVSVLFADLVGSTSFAEDRDPEDVRAMLTAYFEAASRRSSGTAARWRSSSATPSWRSSGTPVAHEDDAERAVRAALDVVDRVASLGLRLGVNRGPGVLTGEAVATVGAVGTGLVAATSSTPRPGCSRQPSRAPSWSARARSARRPVPSRSPRSTRSR